MVDTREAHKTNSFDCRHYIVIIETVGKHKATGIMNMVLYKNDTWNIENMNKSLELIKKFNQKLEEKLRFDRQSNRGLARVMLMYKYQLQMLSEEMKKVKGYPIKTKISIKQTVHTKQSNPRNSEIACNEEDSGIDFSNPKSALDGIFGKKAKKKFPRRPQKKNQIQID